jgi:O-antigen/teichoic acid export membrane protein
MTNPGESRRADRQAIEPRAGLPPNEGDSSSSTAVAPFAHVPPKRSFLRHATRSRTLWQAGLFAVSNVGVGLLGIVSTATLARSLPTSGFGSYAFAIAFLTFVAMIFEFGFFASAARLAAIADRRRQREIVGAALLLYLPVGAGFCGTIFALSFAVDSWFHVQAGEALRIAAPVAIAIPFSLIVQQLAQGTDRLHIASISAVFFQLLIVCLFAIAVAVGSLGVTSAVVLRCIAGVGAASVALLWFRPLFRGVAERVSELARHAREYGFHIYIGRLLSIGTYNMDVLMLGALASSRSVGFYTLAGSIAAVAGLPVLGLANALFAPLAREREIRSRWLLAAVCGGAISAVGAWALAGPFIGLVFSDRYALAARLVLPLALAQAVRGVTSVYHSFLSAHGRGRELRNAGLVLTASNLVLNFGLIPPFGAMGAAWASFLALVANLIAHIVFYRQAIAGDAHDPSPKW